jgi:succinate dehydrogenase/fumarate reductase flavoprotein subunit
MKLQVEPNRLKCDVLIIGGGGTGISAAITARRLGADVIVASKAKVGYANNTFISAGILSSPGRGDVNDTPEAHAKDIVESGRRISDPQLSAVVAKQAQDHVTFLEGCGVDFNRKDGVVEAVQFPGHSFARNVQTTSQRGSGYMLPMVKSAKKIGGRFLDHMFISRLFAEESCISGAMGIDREGTFFIIQAKSIILATGGFAQVYRNNNNAFGITGDGHALAYDLGVPLRDMEFVQFYPTWGTFYEFTVAMAGAGLINAKGEDILKKHGMHDPGSITRDRLSIAVFTEIRNGLGVDGGVIVDFKTVSEDIMPLLTRFLPKGQTDVEEGRVVKPCAHFSMGGLVVNTNGMTAIDGLFAAGEVCGGVHGANRLGGNALAEVFSMGRITGKNARDFAEQTTHKTETPLLLKEEMASLSSVFNEKGHKDIKELTSHFKQVIWENAGIIRNRNSLETALSAMDTVESEMGHAKIAKARDLMKFLELKNMISVSRIMCRSALLRKESRGSHYRSDFPQEDAINGLKYSVARKDDGDMKLDLIPV